MMMLVRLFVFIGLAMAVMGRTMSKKKKKSNNTESNVRTGCACCGQDAGNYDADKCQACEMMQDDEPCSKPCTECMSEEVCGESCNCGEDDADCEEACETCQGNHEEACDPCDACDEEEVEAAAAGCGEAPSPTPGPAPPCCDPPSWMTSSDPLRECLGVANGACQGENAVHNEANCLKDCLHAVSRDKTCNPLGWPGDCDFPKMKTCGQAVCDGKINCVDVPANRPAHLGPHGFMCTAFKACSEYTDYWECGGQAGTKESHGRTHCEWNGPSNNNPPWNREMTGNHCRARETSPTEIFAPEVDDHVMVCESSGSCGSGDFSRNAVVVEDNGNGGYEVNFQDGSPYTTVDGSKMKLAKMVSQSCKTAGDYFFQDAGGTNFGVCLTNCPPGYKKTNIAGGGGRCDLDNLAASLV